MNLRICHDFSPASVRDRRGWPTTVPGTEDRRDDRCAPGTGAHRDRRTRTGVDLGGRGEGRQQGRLRPVVRTALRFYHGLSVPEVAERMARNPRAVSAIQLRALRKLAEVLISAGWKTVAG